MEILPIPMLPAQVFSLGAGCVRSGCFSNGMCKLPIAMPTLDISDGIDTERRWFEPLPWR